MGGAFHSLTSPSRRYRERYWSPPPADRAPPFLLVIEDARWVLIAPFPKRRAGLTPDERTAVEIVAAHLATLDLAGPLWLAADGTATPATIGAAQIRRRLLDNATFTVRAADLT